MIVKLCIIVINDNAIYCLNLEIKSILSKLHSLWIKRSMHDTAGLLKLLNVLRRYLRKTKTKEK
jgi:hypothetical protein